MAVSIEKRGKNIYKLIASEGYDLHGKPLIHGKTVHGTKKESEVEFFNLNLPSLIIVFNNVFTSKICC